MSTFISPSDNYIKKLCCDELKSNVDNDKIKINFWQLDGEVSFYIYGKPDFVDDGDDYWDDMTETIKIDYCPFCGSKLPENVSKLQ